MKRVLFLSSVLFVAHLHAQNTGVVVDQSTKSAIVFDADTDTVSGNISFSSECPGDLCTMGDCAITSNGTRALISNFNYKTWVVDISSKPPALIGSISTSNKGEDISITPDQKYAVVCDGNSPERISVVDLAGLSEISSFDLGAACNSVDVCGNGSVLVTSYQAGAVVRLTIDSNGALSPTTDILPISGPNNAVCAPGGASAYTISRQSREIQAFKIPGMIPMNKRTLTGDGYGLSGAFNPSGTRAFTRTDSTVDAYDYNPVSGGFSESPSFSLNLYPPSDNAFFGIDQLAVHPSGNKLYVTRPSAVEVRDASNGSLLNIISDISIEKPTGICFPSYKAPCPLQAPAPQLPAGAVPINNPTFTWNSVAGADAYIALYVPVNNPAAAEILGIVSGTSLNPSSPIPNGDYAWVVAAYSQVCGLGAFSAPTFFTIPGTCPIGAPVLESPVNGIYVFNPIEYHWSPRGDSASLFILVVVSATTGLPVLQEITSTTAFKATTPLDAGVYGWIVLPYNTTCGVSTPSEVNFFQVLK